MASLQDQLLKAGMVDAKKAKQLAKEKRKHAKQVRKGIAEQENEIKHAAEQAQLEKTAKDRELNLRNQQLTEEKAITAQIIQLISSNRITKNKGEIGFQFADNKKIKKIYVDEAQQRQLEKGQIAIVKLKEQYELVAAAIAEKIAQRNKSMVLVQNQKTAKATELEDEDPYADFKVPDNLMW